MPFQTQSLRLWDSQNAQEVPVLAVPLPLAGAAEGAGRAPGGETGVTEGLPTCQARGCSMGGVVVDVMDGVVGTS